MANYVELAWHPQDSAHLSRKDRAPGRFRAFVPDALGSERPRTDQVAQQAAEDALAALARADERIGSRVGYLHHVLIRSESISSSWIEGNRVTPKKLVVAELRSSGTREAFDVVANVLATEEAITDLADRTRPVTTADIERLQHVIEPSLASGLRTEQNWVGGPGWSPLRADFVPPPESEVGRLVDDLALFVTETSGNPLVRAAIAHAQFETIHPFTDGNGRTGRALFHTALSRGMRCGTRSSRSAPSLPATPRPTSPGSRPTARPPSGRVVHRLCAGSRAGRGTCGAPVRGPCRS